MADSASSRQSGPLRVWRTVDTVTNAPEVSRDEEEGAPDAVLGAFNGTYRNELRQLQDSRRSRRRTRCRARHSVFRRKPLGPRLRGDDAIQNLGVVHLLS